MMVTKSCEKRSSSHLHTHGRPLLSTRLNVHKRDLGWQLLWAVERKIVFALFNNNQNG